MASIIIRNIEDDIKERLRRRASLHHHSMEEEVREILRSTVAHAEKKSVNLAEAIHSRFAALGDVKLDMPERDPIRTPPDFKDSK